MTSPLPWICLLALSGCVTKGRYELMDVQLQATRTARNASALRCQQDLQTARDRSSSCASEVAGRQAQLDALAAELHAVRRELEALQMAEVARAAEPVDGGPVGASGPSPGMLAEGLRVAADQRIAADRLAQAQARVREGFAPMADKGVLVRATPDGSVVVLPVTKLFNEERMSLSPLGLSLLAQTSEALRLLPDHQLEVRGHTDGRDHHSAAHASSWELGFGWAMGVLRGLEENGIPMHAIASSWADTAPLDDRPAATRRVELVLRISPTWPGGTPPPGSPRRRPQLPTGPEVGGG